MTTVIDYYAFPDDAPGMAARRPVSQGVYREAALTDRLLADVHAAGGPELVNDGPTTAPSKRLKCYHPGYAKTLDGPLAVAGLGLPALRRSCPHLDSWLDKLDQSRGT